MNDFESDWISLSQIQSGVRVFLSDFERRKQCVCIQDGSVWIKHCSIQDGCHHQVESEWMSEVFYANGGEWSVSEVFLVANGGTNLIKGEWVWQEKLRWLNTTWQNSKWLPLSSSVRMNGFESNWIRLSQSFVKNGKSKMAGFKMVAIIKLIRLN